MFPRVTGVNSNRFNYSSPSDTFSQTRHQNADIASSREKTWNFFYSKKRHPADQYCILCYLATRYGDLLGNLIIREAEQLCSFLRVGIFMNCSCCFGKGVILYMRFAGSVLLRLILNICIHQ